MSTNEIQIGGTHYKKQKIQHWDYVIANDIPYMEAQVIKYVSRWRDKGGLQDLEKARHFLDKLIEVNTESVALEAPLRRAYPEVKPDGWVEFTFEGANIEQFLFTCKKCREQMWIPAHESPYDHHDCAGKGYVDQE